MGAQGEKSGSEWDFLAADGSRSEAHPSWFDDGQLPGELGNQGCLAEEAREQLGDIGGSRRGGNNEDNDACIVSRRIVPDIGKIEIASHQTLLLSLRMTGNFPVVRMPQSNVPDVHSFIAMAAYDVHGRAWQIRIDEECHAETGR